MKIKTICINLVRRADRKVLMEEELAKHKDILDYEFIEAIDGREVKNYPENFNTPSLYACLLSHSKALQRAKVHNFDNVLIIEDDVVFCSDLKKRLKLFLDIAPDDWDILMLGYYPFTNYFPEPEPVSQLIYRSKGCMGAFAYMVKKEFYDTVLDAFADEKGFTDNILADLHREHKAYVFQPTMVYVREDYSDLAEKTVNHKNIKSVFQETL